MDRKKVGIYGGSFDPIHFGHLNLALQIMEKRRLDEVWFCPSSINPNKKAGSCADNQQRLEMLKIAIEDVPQFKVCDLELKRSGISYTVDTLNELKSLHPMTDFFLIMGKDAADRFHSWHLPDGIVKIAHPLVGLRYLDISFENLKGSPLVVEALTKGMTLTHVFDISSSEIRKRLAHGMYCGYLIPMKVLDYILTNHLYLAD